MLRPQEYSATLLPFPDSTSANAVLELSARLTGEAEAGGQMSRRGGDPDVLGSVQGVRT